MAKEDPLNTLQKKLQVYGTIEPIEEKNPIINKIGLDDLLWAADKFLCDYPKWYYQTNFWFTDRIKKVYRHAYQITQKIPYTKADIEHFCYAGLEELKHHGKFNYIGLFISALMNNPRIEEKDFYLIFTDDSRPIEYLGAFLKNTVLEIRGKGTHLENVGYCSKRAVVFCSTSLGHSLGEGSSHSEYYTQGNAGLHIGANSKQCFFWIGGNAVSCSTEKSSSTFVIEGDIDSIYGNGKSKVYAGGKIKYWTRKGPKTKAYSDGKLIPTFVRHTTS